MNGDRGGNIEPKVLFGVIGVSIMNSLDGCNSIHEYKHEWINGIGSNHLFVIHDNVVLSHVQRSHSHIGVDGNLPCFVIATQQYANDCIHQYNQNHIGPNWNIKEINPPNGFPISDPTESIWGLSNQIGNGNQEDGGEQWYGPTNQLIEDKQHHGNGFPDTN
jgi:hypothetical protein